MAELHVETAPVGNTPTTEQLNAMLGAGLPVGVPASEASSTSRSAEIAQAEAELAKDYAQREKLALQKKAIGTPNATPSVLFTTGVTAAGLKLADNLGNTQTLAKSALKQSREAFAEVATGGNTHKAVEEVVEKFVHADHKQNILDVVHNFADQASNQLGFLKGNLTDKLQTLGVEDIDKAAEKVHEFVKKQAETGKLDASGALEIPEITAKQVSKMLNIEKEKVTTDALQFISEEIKNSASWLHEAEKTAVEKLQEGVASNMEHSGFAQKAANNVVNAFEGAVSKLPGSNNGVKVAVVTAGALATVAAGTIAAHHVASSGKRAAGEKVANAIVSTEGKIKTEKTHLERLKEQEAAQTVSIGRG